MIYTSGRGTFLTITPKSSSVSRYYPYPYFEKKTVNVQNNSSANRLWNSELEKIPYYQKKNIFTPFGVIYPGSPTTDLYS